MQPQSAKLLDSQWDQLQSIVKWIRPTAAAGRQICGATLRDETFSLQPMTWFIVGFTSQEKIHAVLVLLAIRSLGKSKSVSSQVPKDERSPESVVLHLIDNFRNVVPSVQALSEDGLMYAKGALNLHSIFNLAQMLQGENVPANVAQLQENVKRDGSEVLRFYILFLLGFMSGLGAGRGSKFLTARRAESVIEGVRMLKYLLEASACGIYWGPFACLQLSTVLVEDLASTCRSQLQC